MRRGPQRNAAGGAVCTTFVGDVYCRNPCRDSGHKGRSGIADLTSLYQLQAYQTSKYGLTNFGLGGVSGLDAAGQAQLVAAITFTEIIQETAVTRMFVADTSAALSVPAAGSGLDIVVTDFGAGVTKAVVENRLPGVATLTDLGLTSGDANTPTAIVQVYF